MAKDTKFRREVAERIGPGFDLPKIEMVEAVPSVTSSHEMRIVVDFEKLGEDLAPRARFELSTLRLTAE